MNLDEYREFNRLLLDENGRIRVELDDRTRERDTNVQLRKESLAALDELKVRVGDLQASEAELVSEPLRARISVLERRLDESENLRKRFHNELNEAQQHLANHKAALASAEKCLAEAQGDRDKWRQAARERKDEVDELKLALLLGRSPSMEVPPSER